MLSIRTSSELTGEPQRNYLFKTVVESYPPALLAQYQAAKPVLDGMDCVLTKGAWPERKNANIKFEWGGEFINFSGVDESSKEFEFEAIVDEDAKVDDFFNACKDLTGNKLNNAASPRVGSRLTLGVYLVSVNKETVTNYRQLQMVKIDSVSVDPLQKDGKDLLKLKIGITWDFVGYDESKRGKTI